MTSYNPSAPDRLGLEWPAMRQRWDPLGTTITPGAIVTARSTVVFDRIRAFLRYDSTPGGSATVVANIYTVPPPPAVPTLLKTFLALNVTSTTGAWMTFFGGSPATLSFAIGTQYLIVLRRQNAATSVSWATLDATTTVGSETETTPDHRAVDVPLDPVTFAPNAPVAIGPDTAARALAFSTSLNVLLIDSQVYALAVPTPIDVNHVPLVQAMPVSTTQVGSITLLVRNDIATHHADPLVISFPDDPTILPVQFPIGLLPVVPDNRWYRVAVELNTPLPSGIAHRVQLSSVTTNDRPWTIGGLTAGATGDAQLGLRTFQGVGAGADTTYDAVLTNDALLAPVTSFTVTSTLCDVSRGVTNCTLTSVPVATLDWPALSAIESKLDRYEIQRNDDGVWRDIAEIRRADTPSVLVPPTPTRFIDQEALRNTPVSYRIRMVTTAGVVSGWRYAGPITLPSAEPDVMLFSNWRPDLCFACYDENGYTWSPVDAGRLSVRMLFARNRQFAVRETVFRGDQFDRSLILAVSDPGMPRIPDQTLVGSPSYAPPGRVVFDPLLAIAHARDVPYVCFLDAFSRRWYTAPAVTGLHKDEPWKQYRADVSFVEVSDVPAPITLESLPPLAVAGIGWDNLNWSPGAGDGNWETA